MQRNRRRLDQRPLFKAEVIRQFVHHVLTHHGELRKSAASAGEAVKAQQRRQVVALHLVSAILVR